MPTAVPGHSWPSLRRVGALLVAGTTSDAGKSVITAGMCRWLARQGVAVAPFKAQNMSLNSFVTLAGEEIGRAQAAQARASGIEPEAVMNPVLLKPGAGNGSQLIVLGKAVAETDAATYWTNGHQRALLDVVVDSYRDLTRRFDVVICEGAGSPAEINLRESDIVNMGFARATGVPAVLVGDIDRGGVFAALVGTLALLEPADQALVAGFIVNKFRGEQTLLKPGLGMLEELTGRPVLGVLPYTDGISVDAEDAIDWALLRSGGPPRGEDVLRISVVAFPRMSNHTDLDALACEPGVVVRFARQAAELADADLVVLPGSRATVADLAWLRERQIDQAIVRHAARGLPVLGICGGYQMLGTLIDDDVESGAGQVRGLAMLPVRTEFGREKVLARPSRTLADGVVVHGYEIHHGVVSRDSGEPFFADEGCRVEAIAGTSWHGLMENDGFRREYLSYVARVAGRNFTGAQDVCFEAIREAKLDRLADLIADNLDCGHVRTLLDSGAPPLPSVRLSLQAGPGA
jgi:adenosylcobyric acid synthase